jgi:hypothetical protein
MLRGLIIASLCAIVPVTPACAVEELQDCDDIKDAGNRMICLQAHIAHLEQTLLRLNTELVDIRHELQEKLAADEVYKLQYVGKRRCLGFADNDKPPVFASCDRPDSWKLMRGSQLPETMNNAPKSAGNSADQSTDNSSGKSPDNPKAQAQSGGKSQGKQQQGNITVQPKTAPQPN